MNIFSEIAKGVTWVGKEIVKVSEWVPKVVTIANDVKGDAETLLPQVVKIFEDADAVVIAAVKDSGADIAALGTFIAALTVAVQKDGIDITSDSAAYAALTTFVATVKNLGNYTDVIAAVGKLVTDYDAFGASSKAAIAKIQADAV